MLDKIGFDHPQPNLSTNRTKVMSTSDMISGFVNIVDRNYLWANNIPIEKKVHQTDESTSYFLFCGSAVHLCSAPGAMG